MQTWSKIGRKTEVCQITSNPNICIQRKYPINKMFEECQILQMRDYLIILKHSCCHIEGKKVIPSEEVMTYK